MNWLVSSTGNAEADDRYQRWLAREGVAASWIGPSLPSGVSVETAAALLLTGGGDVDPRRYGCTRDPHTTDVVEERDEVEMNLVRRFLAARRPVFGICRGIQLLSVALGGRLIQHLPDRVFGETHEKEGDDDAEHAVLIEAGSLLAGILGREARVNSAHHQAVDPAAPGSGLRVTARSPAGVVEAVEGKTASILAVQWHPERLPSDHPASRGLLRLMRDLSVSAHRS